MRPSLAFYQQHGRHRCRNQHAAALDQGRMVARGDAARTGQPALDVRPAPQQAQREKPCDHPADEGDRLR